jgi:hypothetical protein
MKKQFNAIQLTAIIVTILMIFLFFLFIIGLHLYLSNQALQEKEESSITNSQSGIIQPKGYEIIHFYSSNNEGIAQTHVLVIYLKPKMLVERSINITLYLNGSVDVYLINASLVQTAGNIEKTIGEKSLYKWFNVTFLHVNINDTSTYFPELIIFNKNNQSTTYNASLCQKVTFLHPHYIAAFRGFWLSIISFIILNLFYVILPLFYSESSQVTILNILLNIPGKLELLITPAKYKPFLQIEKANNKTISPIPIALLVFSLITLYFSNCLECLYGSYLMNIAKTNEFLLYLLMNITYSLYVSIMLIFLPVFLIVNDLIFHVLYAMLSIPKYSAFKDLNDFRIYNSSPINIYRRTVVLFLLYYFVLLFSILLLARTFDSFPYILLFVLSPLMAIIGYAMASEETKHYSNLNTFKMALLSRFELCITSMLIGITVSLSAILAYYFIPWNSLNNIALVSGFLQETFSRLTSFFLTSAYTFPVPFLILYLSFALSYSKYISDEDQYNIYNNNFIKTPLETTVISFSSSILYSIFYKASKSSGDPIKRMIDGAISVLNPDSFLTSVLIVLAIILIRDYYSLARFMKQLRDK